LPLSAAAQAQWNDTSALAFFESVIGLPYGYHNFLFGWIDTPDNNYPPLMPPHLLPIAFSIFSDFMPSVTEIFIEQALNKRLGTEGLKFPGIAAAAADKNMTIEDVMAIPEIQGWIYTGILPRDG
jgi:hypothetical protein